MKLIKTTSNHRSETKNPFNIRPSADKWLGMVGYNQSNFVVFDTLENGLRAGLKNLNTQIKKGRTIRTLISEYAPPSENDTKTYINNVVKFTGIPHDTKLTKEHIPALGLAILKQEGSYTPPPDVYKAALKAAIGNIIQKVINLAFLFLLQFIR